MRLKSFIRTRMFIVDFSCSTKMGLVKSDLLIIALICSTASAFHMIHPMDKEMVYEWKALVKAGTHLPIHHASQMVMHGKLRMQTGTNSTQMKLEDLKFHLYNGVLNHVQEHKDVQDVPIPPEMKELQMNPFKVVHDSNGLAIGMVTEKDEPEFIRNMKKAIASIMQLDHGVMKSELEHHGFVKKEHSIYGYGAVDYMVHKHSDYMAVHKLHDMRHSGHLYQHFFTNTEPMMCDVPYEEALMHDSQKRYKIVKHEGHHLVKHIEADGALYYYPFEAQSHAQYILVNQTFDFVEMLPMQTPMEVKNEHFENDLTFHPFEEETNGAIVDVTHKRRMLDYQMMTKEVMEGLEEMWTYLHEDHIHTEVPDAKHGQTVNRLYSMLIHFPTDKMEELHTAIKANTGAHHEQMMKMFYQVLPMVGTHAAAKLMKKMIMEKMVTDQQAMHMLQRLAEYIQMPTESFLMDMEPLMHLDDTHSWMVRKAGILMFGSMVHKSHKYEMKKHHHDHDNDAHSEHSMSHGNMEEPYEKYVMEYVKKAKESTDYKMKILYFDGLFNMKMQSTMKHLRPALNGEWGSDHHVRVWILGAMVPSILQDKNPDTAIEFLWPILTNRKEHTEMRITAYLYIMESQPTPSRLANIFWYMMTEPNDELYHFHYTFVKSMMESTELCKHEQRLRMKQLMKFMHPPTRGSSTASLTDYMSSMFGYSGSMEGYMITTNESHILMVGSNSQLFNSYSQDYMVYVKLHGVLPKNMSPLWMLHKMMMGGTSEMMKPKSGMHMEIGLVRHQHVINSWYLDESNDFKDLMETELSFMNIFSKDKHSMGHECLEVMYDRFHRALVPTDLGMPAVWTYQMPMVQYANMSLARSTVNNVMNLKMTGRYVLWSHGHHSIMLYNPVADVWHGVGRYQVMDAVLPMNGDMSYNMNQQILQMSWEKHPEPLMNVAGMRSHVHQSTFMLMHNDDYHKKLMEMSKHSKLWVRVSMGKDYHHKYMLMDDDDLNTGHKWMVAVYDSTMRVTNGSMQAQMHNMMRMQAKQDAHSMLDVMKLMISPLDHFMKHLEYMPSLADYGFMIRMEPSHEHPVSNIDLSIRMNVEPSSVVHQYSPAGKMSTRMTYAVKNKGQSMKTWDMHATMDMNPGHTVNTMKMYMTRIVPGQKDYKICMEGVKKWTNKGVSGHMNVAMSQTSDGKCVTDDTVIDVTMVGERSHEQDQEHHMYGACQYVVPYAKMPYHTMHCLASHTSVRHYVYNVKTSNVPTEFKKMFARIWDDMRGSLISHYTFEDDHDMDVPEHNLKIDVMYPMQSQEMDMEIATPHHVHRLSGVSTKGLLQGMGMVPDSTVYSHMLMKMQGMMDRCVVRHDRHSMNHHEHAEELPKEWTMFVGDNMENPKKAVYVKQMANHQIAVKMVDMDHMVEMVPNENGGHQMMVDGQVSPNQDQHHEEWMDYHTFMHEMNKPVAVMMHLSGLHVEYDGQHAIIMVPEAMQKNGRCYDH